MADELRKRRRDIAELRRERNELLKAMARRLNDDGPTQKQILLLRLTNLADNVPGFSCDGAMPAPVDPR